MRVIIIEDEPPAAERLSRLLRKIDPAASIDAVLDGVGSAGRWLAEHPQPELAFLDIQLADGLSFELLEKGVLRSPVIFVTAYDRYAIRAFKVNSVDYLLKPLDPKELKAALEKFQAGRRQSLDLESIIGAIRDHRPSYRRRFLIPHADQFIAVEAGAILFVTSGKKSSSIVLADGSRYQTADSLDDLEDQLDPASFFRANRQYLLSYGAISGIHAYFNGKLSVYLKRLPEHIIVSKEKAGAFKKWLNR